MSLSKIRKKIFLFFVVFFISALIGVREPSVGTDSKHYIEIFNGLINSSVWLKYEPGFEFFVRAVGVVSEKSQFIFFCIGLFITAFYLYSYSKYTAKTSFSSYFILLSLMLLSSWYLTFTTNGLRQGMSLSILYLAVGYLVNYKYYKFCFYLFFACIFHYSTVLILPFLFLLFAFKINLKSLIFVYMTFSLGYLFGINEMLVMKSSNIMGVPVYNMLKNYGGDSAKWVGFQANLYLYTNFWFFFGVALCVYKKSLLRGRSFTALTIYGLLCLPYFVFGFGGYSNRIAQIAWFFIPILQSVFIYKFSLGNLDRLILSVLLFLGSFFYFSMIMLLPYFKI